jgi:hypothetical protein
VPLEPLAPLVPLLPLVPEGDDNVLTI